MFKINNIIAHLSENKECLRLSEYFYFLFVTLFRTLIYLEFFIICEVYN